jgi:Ca2+-binding RTX toxin-like protein
MPTQKTDRHTTWFLDQADETWTLAKTATIAVRNEDGIHENTSGSDIQILGDIVAHGPAKGIEFQGFDSSVTIAASGSVKSPGDTAIFAEGNGSAIDNHGLIQAKDAGIDVALKADIDNFGSISGATAVLLEGDGSRIENHGEISGRTGIGGAATDSVIVNAKGATISGHSAAISLSSHDPAFLATIENHGTISGNHVAIRGSVGDIDLTNDGRIHGDIRLGDGDDVVDTRKGIIDGTVYGGDGWDTYRIGHSRVTIVEGVDRGHDTVESAVSCQLPVNIETLTLIGRKDINGTGGRLDEFINGNDGDNMLSGKGGADVLFDDLGNDTLIGGGGGDTLVGGGGNDVLIGGGGGDTLVGSVGNDVLTGGGGIDRFDFILGGGIDHIRDFHDGIDFLHFDTVQSQADFDSLDIHQSKAGAVIEHGDGSRIILDGINVADISYADFQ